MTEYVFEIDESRADAMGNVPCERREEIVRVALPHFLTSHEVKDDGKEES